MNMVVDVIKRLPTLAGLAAALAPTFASGEDAFIVFRGEARAQIVVAEHPPRLVALAARELQAYLEKITGARLPVVTAPGDSFPVTIYLGRSEPADRLGIDDEGLEHGAFRMVSGPDWLLLLGRDRDFTPIEPWSRSAGDRERVQAELDALTGEKWVPAPGFSFRSYDPTLGVWEQDESGSLNAAYRFLHDLGVRWYMPGEIGEVVPEMPTVPLPRLDHTVRPDFPFRNLHLLYQHAKPESRLWRLRQGLNSPSFGGSHGINAVHSRPEVRAAHPEYQAIWGGRRTENKPCLSSEGLFRANVAYARFMFDHYNVRMVNISPNDGYSRPCECELCRGKATPERGTEGLLSDYVWGYVNRVAEELYKSHPDRMVSGLAYTSYLLPPEKIERLSPNVAVVFVRWRSPYTDPETKARELAIRAQWLEKLPSREFYVWSEYAHSRPQGWYARLPAYYPRLIAEDLRWLKGKSLGEYIPVADNWPAWGLAWHALAANHLNAYVTARLYWDAEQDLDALLAEYYVKFYGPAAPEMKAFIEYAEQTWWKVGTGEIALAEIERWLELLAAAHAAAGADDVYGRRLAMLWEFTEPRLRELFLEKGGVTGVPALVIHPRDVKHGQPWLVEVDGRLDEASWAGDPRHRLVDAATGAGPEIETYFQLGTDGEYLYFAARCAEPDMKALTLTADGPDNMNVWRDDAVSLALVAPDQFNRHFSFNPAGAYVQQDRGAPGLAGVNWRSGLTAAAFRAADYWSVEARIPLAAFGEQPPAVGTPWRINVGRERPRPNDRRVWTLVPTGDRDFHFLESATTELVFEATAPVAAGRREP